MDNNNNDKYIYVDTFSVVLYLFQNTIPIILIVLPFINILPPFLISNNIIKYAYILLLLPILDILFLCNICLYIIAFETLCISKKPVAILGKDSVSIFDVYESGYIRIKYKDIKGMRIGGWGRGCKYLEIKLDDYEIYYIQSSNILSKLINKIQKRQPHIKDKNIRLESIHYTTSSSSFEEFKNSVIERANKHRRIPIYLKYW